MVQQRSITRRNYAPGPVLIRCDGSSAIGLGHVVRCASLAIALRRRSVNVEFLLGPASDALSAVLLERMGLPFKRLRDGGDPEVLGTVVEGARAAWVVLDLRGELRPLLSALRDRARTAVIDDVGDRGLVGTDLVVNQNLGATDLYPAMLRRRLLAGPRYALLRPQFARLRATLSPRFFEETDNRLLILLGGGAVERELATIVDELDGVEQELDCRVLLARASTGELGRAGTGSRHRVQVVERTDEVAPHMVWADLAVTATGSTSLELACLGVPMVTIVLGPDQARNAEELIKAECARSAGAESNFGAGVAAAVREGLADVAWRRKASARGRALIDGTGAERVADVLSRSADLEEHGGHE